MTTLWNVHTSRPRRGLPRLAPVLVSIEPERETHQFYFLPWPREAPEHFSHDTRSPKDRYSLSPEAAVRRFLADQTEREHGAEKLLAEARSNVKWAREVLTARGAQA